VGKNKIAHFEETKTFKNFFQYTYDEIIQGVDLKGNWISSFFQNTNPLVLELGCGKGEYSVGLARKYPNKNFIGMDIKGARMWRGCKTSIEEQLSNVAFVRSQIELIEHVFGNQEVDEIWITFPDPQPREFKARKRLTSARFLENYRKILKKDGIIHLKTDNDGLYEYTLEVIEEDKHNLLYSSNDLYKSDYKEEAIQFQTFYEQKYLKTGKNINYIKFRLNDQ
jgi:tRNA (guanine-N7-)-methyltransferase